VGHLTHPAKLPSLHEQLFHDTVLQAVERMNPVAA
jgi:hypothetical protein